MFRGSSGLRGCIGLFRWSSFTVRTETLTTPGCPRHAARRFSISAPLRGTTHVDDKQPVRQWALHVSPFSTVRARLACSISIRPLDVHSFPEADRAFVTVHAADTEQEEVGVDHLHVHYDNQTQELLISAEKVTSDVSIDVAAPIKSSECRGV